MWQVILLGGSDCGKQCVLMGFTNTHYSSDFVSTFIKVYYLQFAARISSIDKVPGVQIL